ncbi:MAG TPA: hypothetical protein ENK47_05605 [Euryarchaeota archaeon]|nr:hypothetical protein [Euryarchaeota archaeon]
MSDPFGNILSHITTLLLLGTVLPLGAAPIQAQARDSGDDPLSDVDFQHQNLYHENSLLFRATFGDLIPGNGFDEMAVCSKNGRITVTYGSDMSWTTELAEWAYIDNNPNDPAEVYSLAAGDILPDRAGDELVSVDSDYSVRMITYDNGSWNSKTIWRDDDWLYEVAIGELVPGNEGPELVVVGESGRATLLTRSSDDTWTSEVLFRDNFAIDTCLITDFDPFVPGNEILVAGIDRNVTLIERIENDWIPTDISFLGSSVIDLASSDLDASIPGEEIYASTFDGNIFMIENRNGSFSANNVHHEGAMVYCLESGILDDENVIVMSTWNNRVALLYNDNTDFRVREVYREDYVIPGCAIFDVDPYHKGAEIFSLSGLGYITMIYHDDPGADIILPFNETTVSMNETLSLPFMVRYKGGYNGIVEVEVTSDGNVSTEHHLRFDEEGIYKTNISIDRKGQHVIRFGIAPPSEGPSRELIVRVVDDDRPVFFDPVLLNEKIGANRQISRDLIVMSERDVGNPFLIEPVRVPTGISIVSNRTVIDPLGEPIHISLIVSVSPIVSPGATYFFLRMSSTDGRSRAVGLTIHILESSVTDFDLIFQRTSIEAAVGDNISVDLLIVPINSFQGIVNLTLADDVEGISVAILPEHIEPPGTVSVAIEVLQDTGPYFVTIRGASGNLVREETFMIETSPPRPDILIEGPQDPVLLAREGGDVLRAEFTLNITPVQGTLSDVRVEVIGASPGTTISISPSELRNIPYRVPVTFRIDAPLNTTLSTLTVIFSNDDNEWIYNISLKKAEEAKENSGSGLPSWTFSLIIGIVIIILLLLIHKGKGANTLNRKRQHGEIDVRNKGASHSDTAHERHHGRSGGLDRMVR